MDFKLRPTKDDLIDIISSNLNLIQSSINGYLAGNRIIELEPILTRLGRGGSLPHWYEGLKTQKLPNYDGKTIGSIVEMMLLATIEHKVLSEVVNLPQLTINPAKGVDFPQLSLGVKSPSDNLCTSEPFFSTYERLLGNNHDSLVLLTNYQDKEFKDGKVTLAIKKTELLKGSELADKNLCELARNNREFLLDKSDVLCKKLIQFLAHINQSNFIANSLIKLIKVLQCGKIKIDNEIDKIKYDLNKRVKKQIERGEIPFDDYFFVSISRIKETPHQVEAIINCCNDWVIENVKEFARLPNNNEWERFLLSPLDGKISISFALQWRYNFSNVFGKGK